MMRKLGLGVLGLVACGGGSGENPPSPELAGGETSEFSGDIGACPEVVSNVPVDLADPEVASWRALAEGHHELTLGWEQRVLSAAVGGFDEHTHVSIDVTALRARDLEYGSGEAASGDATMCDGLHVRQLELDIQIATADGAVATRIRRWFESTIDVTSEPRLVEGYLHPDRDPRGGDFGGSLAWGLDPASGGTSSVMVAISFGAESVIGELFPILSKLDAAYVPNRSSWQPVHGTFPEHACASPYETPISLDENVESIGGTARVEYRRAADAWEREPIPAVWQAPDGSAQPAVEVPPPTQVSLSAGEPTDACSDGSRVTVHAPLQVSTADGRVNLTRSFAWELFANDSVATDERTPWLPAADFDTQTGVQANLGVGSYGSLDLHHAVESSDDRVYGWLSVSTWDAFLELAAPYPRLEWCRGRNCSLQPSPL